MMRSYIFVGLLLSGAVITDAELSDYLCYKHEFYKGPPDMIEIPKDDLELLFKRLDKDNNGNLDKADLEVVFNNPRAVGDCDRFISDADSDDSDQTVSKEEFEKFMADQSVVWAVAGCKYEIRSKLMKTRCYVDEFVTYVHAMMPYEKVVALFESFAGAEKGVITEEEVKKNFQVNNPAVIENLVDEWGHEDKKISFIEFKSYVRQEDLYVEVKPCLEDIKCYKETMFRYTMFALTENDIHKLFHYLDRNHDNKLDESDLGTNGEIFITTVDTLKEGTVTFEEFRLFLKKKLVRNLMQERCGLIYDTPQQLDCYDKNLIELVRYTFRTAKIYIPHRHIYYIFEELDVDKNGQINNEDLKHFQQDEGLRSKILNELDTSASNENVNLEELDYFISYPTTVYALSGCLFEPDAQKSTCFAKALIEFTSFMMTTLKVNSFFKAYSVHGRQKLTKDEIQEFIPEGKTHDEDVQNFINELGLGDDEVTLFEFSSYVRHTDLRPGFEKCDQASTDEAEVNKAKQGVLLEYIQKSLTEYDIEVVFDEFDVNKDDEIEIEDLKRLLKKEEEAHKFLKTIDTTDESENVDFREFRYYLLKPENRKLLEEECTIPKETQVEEIACYMEKIWIMAIK